MIDNISLLHCKVEFSFTTLCVHHDLNLILMIIKTIMMIHDLNCALYFGSLHQDSVQLQNAPKQCSGYNLLGRKQCNRTKSMLWLITGFSQQRICWHTLPSPPPPHSSICPPYMFLFLHPNTLSCSLLHLVRALWSPPPPPPPPS